MKIIASKRYDEHDNQLVTLNINEFKDVINIFKNWEREIINSFYSH